MADVVSSLLSSVIPPPLFTILAGFSNLVYRLVLGVSNDPTSWSSTLLPPLIALVCAYISLLLAYRTLKSTILLIWWGIKWGAIIGIGLAIWAWWVGEEEAVRSALYFEDADDMSHVHAIIAEGGALAAAAGPLLASLQARAGNVDGNAPPQAAANANSFADLISSDSLGSLANSIGLMLNDDSQDGRAGAAHQARLLRSVVPEWMSNILDEFQRGSASASTNRRPATRSERNRRSQTRNRPRNYREDSIEDDILSDFDDDYETPPPPPLRNSRARTRSQTTQRRRRN